MKTEMLDRLLECRAARRPAVVVTRLADGAQALVESDRTSGRLALTDAQRVAARGRLLVEASAFGDGGLFYRSYPAPLRLVIVGAVHIAQVLAPMAALAGFAVCVVDPRRAFAADVRFPGVELIDDWPDDAIARLAPDARTAVVTLSHDPKLDDPALTAALASEAFYIGALGSTRTHASRVARLVEAGLGERVSRIHAPVGLALGGRSAEEIAVAILAQIVQQRHEREAA